MAFVTYQNRRNPHVTIHLQRCRQIAKNGGEHKYSQGNYSSHMTYAEAHSYAENTKLPLIHCSFCKPPTGR